MKLLLRNEPDQPDPNLTLRANWNQLDFGLWGPNPTWKWAKLALLSTLYGWIQIWTHLEVKPIQPDLFLNPEGQPDPLQPKNCGQNLVEPKKTGRVWPHYVKPY